jgi:hypothetical protein
MMAAYSERGNFSYIKDGSHDYALDRRNGAITEKSNADLSKADCKIVIAAIAKKHPDVVNKIMRRYWKLFD